MLCGKKLLDKNAKLNFKNNDVANWKKIITINILPNISKRKDNQTMKFGQLIVYKVRITFLEKSCRKLDKEISSRPLFPFKKFYRK